MSTLCQILLDGVLDSTSFCVFLIYMWLTFQASTTLSLTLSADGPTLPLKRACRRTSMRLNKTVGE